MVAAYVNGTHSDPSSPQATTMSADPVADAENGKLAIEKMLQKAYDLQRTLEPMHTYDYMVDIIRTWCVCAAIQVTHFTTMPLPASRKRNATNARAPALLARTASLNASSASRSSLTSTRITSRLFFEECMAGPRHSSFTGSDGHLKRSSKPKQRGNTSTERCQRSI